MRGDGGVGGIARGRSGGRRGRGAGNGGAAGAAARGRAEGGGEEVSKARRGGGRDRRAGGVLLCSPGRVRARGRRGGGAAVDGAGGGFTTGPGGGGGAAGPSGGGSGGEGGVRGVPQADFVQVQAVQGRQILVSGLPSGTYFLCNSCRLCCGIVQLGIQEFDFSSRDLLFHGFGWFLGVSAVSLDWCL